MFKWYKILLFTAVFVITVFSVTAQVDPSVDLSPQEQQVYQRSLASFSAGDFNDAYAGFSQLLSLHNREVAFKYYFGICLVEMRRDFSRAEDYLRDAVSAGINMANLYMGHARHYQYDFVGAIGYYYRFKEEARAREIRETDVDRYIRMATNGQELIQYAYDLRVVYNRTINKQNFHYSYDFSDFGGRIIVKPDRYRTRPDRNIKDPDLMYISDRHDVIYMSSYGNRRGGSLNIYRINRSGFDWGEPELLPHPINDEYDQAYPFIAADGITLYFSSKGHNTMGGYDIFKTVYDTISGKWSEPKNLDFPYNTPFDDIMFVTDVYNETAFFSSNRDARDNRITIYRILLEKEPPQKLIASLDDVLRSAKLEVDYNAVMELEKREAIRDIKPDEEDTLTQDSIIAYTEDVRIIDDVTEDVQLIMDSIENASEMSTKYLSSGFLASKNSIQQVKEIRQTIDKLYSGSQPEKSESELRDELEQSALKAVVMYDLVRAGLSNKQRVDAQIEYFERELRNLRDAMASGRNVERQIQELKSNIQRISTENPAELYVKNKNKDLRENADRIEIINNQIADLENNAIILKKRKDSLAGIAYKTRDRDKRNEIISEIKLIEYNQVEINEHIKKFITDREILFKENKTLKAEKSIAENIDVSYAEATETPKLSEIENDIEMIRIFLNQENLKQIAVVQREVSESIAFTPEIDDIIAKMDKISEEEDKHLAEVMKSVYRETTEIFTGKTESPAKEDFFELNQLIAEQNIIKEQLADKEIEFDLSTTEKQKLEVLDQLSRLNNNLNNIETVIKAKISELNLTEVPDVNKNEYLNLRTEAANYSDLQTVVREADDLLNVLDELKDRIVYFEKSGVYDKNAEHEVLKIIEQQLAVQFDKKKSFIDGYVSGKKLFETGQISELITESIDQSHAEKNVDVRELKNLYREMQKSLQELNSLTETIEVSTDQRRVERATENLNQLIPEHLKNQHTYLIKKLEASDSQIEVYISFADRYKHSVPNHSIALFEKAEELTKESEILVNKAERADNITERNLLLAKADVKRELAVLNYEAAFDVAIGRKHYAQVENITPSNETIEMMRLSEDILSKLTVEDTHLKDIPKKPVFMSDDTKIREVFGEIERAEKAINILLEDYQQASLGDKKRIVTQIDSLNNNLQILLFAAKRAVVEIQKEQILFNQKHYSDELTERNYQKMYDEYIDKVERNIDQYSFLLLEEVVILGESVLNFQNQKIELEIFTPPLEADIKNIYRRSENNISWVSAEQISIEQIAEDDIDEFTEVIPEETLEIDDVEGPEAQDTRTEFAEEQPVILVAYESLQHSKNYAQTGLDQIEEYNRSVSEINRINVEINSATGNRQRNELMQQRDELIAAQREQLKRISNKRIQMIAEMKQSLPTNIESDNYQDFIKLLNEAETMRKTISDFGQFHNEQSLAEMNKSAFDLENSAMILYDDIISHAQDLPTVDIEPVLTETQPISIEKFIRESETHTWNRLEGIESQKVDLLIENRNLSAQIDELNYKLPQTKSSRQVRKLRRELEKLESTYIANLKSIAGLEIEMLDIKHNIASNLFDEAFIAGDLNKHISDSLKTVSYNDKSRAMMFYEFVLNYGTGNISPELRRNFEIAGVNADQSLLNIEKSVNIRQDALYNDKVLADEGSQKDQKTDLQIIEEDYTDETESEKIESIVDEVQVFTEDPIAELVEDEREELVISEDRTISYYSESNPIPEKEEQVEEGLNYRIQIGAFNRPVPNETFKGISPILVERPVGSNLLRYVVGIFYSYRTAVAALPTVRALGYNDCFIVAYYNGERIPLYRARQMETSQQLQERLIAEGIIIDQPESATEAVEQSTHVDITESTGAFYCVQIGVYRTNMSPADLYGLSPLTYERLSNGLIRHLFGKYSDYNEAVNQQNRIRRLGISDAFVVAYNGGRRISMAEARRIIVSTGQVEQERIIQDIPIDDREDVSSEQVTRLDRPLEETPPVTETPQASVTDVTPTEEIVPPAQRPVYFVQVGVYRTRLNEIMRNRFNDVSGDYRLYEIEADNGLFIYRIGEFSNYADAMQMQNAARNAGINDAFIMATLNGQRINVSTARSME